jgi:hypothetical protein
MDNKNISESHREEIKNLIYDYKINGDKNFVPYEEGMDAIDKWLDSLVEVYN